MAKFQFSKTTIEHLKELPYIDKELSGGYKVHKKGDIYYISIDDSVSVLKGVENVKGVKTKYNYHTHNEDNYEKYDVKLAFPSNQDYLGFMNSYLYYETFFHTVVTIEGVYFLTIGDFFKKGLYKDKMYSMIRKFICDEYYINYEKGDTVSKYLKYIKTIKYKNLSLFNLQFSSWEKLKLKKFLVY